MKTQLQADESWSSLDAIEASSTSATAKTQQLSNNQDSIIICPPLVQLFQQGMLAQEVYIIESGIVKLIHQDQDGQEMIIGLRTREGVIGAASVMLQKPF